MPRPADKTSDLGHALLGLLARGEATGYDLSARLAAPLGYFWTARHSQVYPELARLEAAGLVTHQVIAGRGPRPTKRYAVTAAGRAALAAWVVTDPGDQPDRDVLVLRAYSLWLADPVAARAMLQGLRERHAARLEEYLAHERRILHPSDAQRDSQLATKDNLKDAAAVDAAAREIAWDEPRFAALATVRAGIGYERHRIAWVDWVVASLAAGHAQ
ncbi:PadR family transcriptional regulator [Arsenicicoccus sp. oral taxon 190]|uniref:PadR family transcriptional regulator n=1 Tax=Arsenicicoccus sp. oral taxon 190 TaxID=1658671 RepID=UPI00067B3595|nr:helix-turn-helix transcriptional regulator [Arsenicicoccus sp. oral taxon 190]